MIKQRLQNARFEIQKWVKYDYIVINEDLDRSYAAIKSIINAGQLRRDRRPGLFGFVTGLLEEDPGM